MIDNIFINTIEFGSYSCNFTSQIWDHLLQFVILKRILRKPPSNQSDSFELNYKFFNDDEFKIKNILKNLKNIAWQNILSQNNISASFDGFFSTRLVLYFTNMHHYINFPKKEKSLKRKPWIRKEIQFLIKKRDKLFKLDCNESDPILKITKHNNSWLYNL